MLHSLRLPPPSSAPTPPRPPPFSTFTTPNRPLYLKFRTSHRENIRYLKSLKLIAPNTKPHNLPSQETVSQILVLINFLNHDKGFSDHDIQTLASYNNSKLFYLDPTDIIPIFEFFALELQASEENSRGLILKCPELLFSDVEFCLRPTLTFLRQVGVKNLSKASSLNAHLLNTKVERLRETVRFLRSVGFTYHEALKLCARMPALFGYSVESNLRPKVEYLRYVMKRELAELGEFPQFFGFSLERKIKPRDLWLKKRGVRLSLKRMLMWSDERFYAKWK